MPRRKLIRAAEPLTPPELGSLEENIWLGDQAAVHANAVAQLRWYDRRGELLIAIQNRDKNAERFKELEAENKGLKEQLEARPPVPSVPTADPESERRLNKMYKQLEEQRQRRETPVPVQEVDPPEEPKPSAEQIKKAAEAAEKKAADELAKKAADDKKAAEDAEAEKQRIAKIDEDYAEVQKRYNRPLDVYERNMPRHQVKSRIAYDNKVIHDYQKEHGLLPKVAATGGVDIEEIKADNARTQREYQAEYNWQVGGCQTTRPTNFGLFRDGE